MLRNIIDNAFKYGQERNKHCTIIIAINQIGNDTIITIEDSGRGVENTEKQQLLNKFYRGKHHQSDGAGLGLSIVQNIVNTHHGTIKLENSAILGGLKLTVGLANILHT